MGAIFGAEDPAVQRRDALIRVLNPRSVAVVGAGRRAGNIGRAILLNLLRDGFEGPVFPVNPQASYVASVPVHASVRDIPEPVDLAIIAVPAPQVLDVARECVHIGVAGIVVISAGFADAGEAGQERQEMLTQLVRAHGVWMIGPNCLGIINTDPEVSLNATFSPQRPLPGHTGLLSQSGAVGIEVIDAANAVGLGLSSFVSAGNKADVSGNDLLTYWENDDNTAVIMLYLESFGNPRRFSELARRVARRKPIIAVKAGRTRAGLRAAASHTGAIASTADAAVDALFHQAGVIRVDTVEDMVDVALVLDRQPLPAGSRVAIVSNSGGPAIMATDACEAAGLVVAELSGVTRRRLRTMLDVGGKSDNPIDLLAAASAADYEAALSAVLADGGVDAVVVIFTRVTPGGTNVVVKAIEAVDAQHPEKTVVCCFLGTDTRVESPRLPCFSTVERGVLALDRVVHHAAWRRQPEGTVPRFPVNHDAVRAIVDRNHGWLELDDTTKLLSVYGITVITGVVVDDALAAVSAAESMGVPVVVKSACSGLVHKTDIDAVRLDLCTADEIIEAVASVRAASGDASSPVIVQPMVPSGVEVIVGMKQDERFGPMVMFGLGGVATELLGDHAFCLAPMSDVEASSLVRSVRGHPLLFGYRNTSLVDVVALEDLLLRVSRLAADVPELEEMDLNPVIVTPSGAMIVDARIRLSDS